jgi:four helix bundle protein
MPVKSFNELIVWQKAIDFVETIYSVTAGFPRDEIYGLTNQLRRAAVSIPSNIAEGQSRQSTRDFLNYLSIARGSLAEVETQLVIAARLKYIKPAKNAELHESLTEVARLLRGLSKSLSPSN